MLKTLAVALSMYSAIPMPQVDWSPKSMRYVMVAFPVVGLFCGLSLLIWSYICHLLNFSPILVGIGAALVPVLVTGGIHLDGFCDTTDALASHAPLEKKLEILKDSHTGAFAIIGVVCYLLFLSALYTEISLNCENIGILTLIFVFSRILSGLSVATFPCAKNSGLVYAFQDGAARKEVSMILFVALGAVIALFGLARPWTGYLIPFGGIGVLAIYRVFSMKTFGGITGDLAGWFLCLAELFMVFCMIVGERL